MLEKLGAEDGALDGIGGVIIQLLVIAGIVVWLLGAPAWIIIGIYLELVLICWLLKSYQHGEWFRISPPDDQP